MISMEGDRNVVDRPKIEGEIGSRDDCLEKETRFGAYSVVLKSAKGLNELLRMGLGLRTEDLYLEVHVPDSVKGAPRAVLGTFKKDALELADFLSEKRLKPRWLIGVTHQNVARPAQRFLNFQVISGIPDEAVDRVILMKMMTSWPSYYMLREDRIGSLKPGKWADFLVLNKDYFTVPVDEIANVHPYLTVVGGKTVFVHKDYAPEIGKQPAGIQVQYVNKPPYEY